LGTISAFLAAANYSDWRLATIAGAATLVSFALVYVAEFAPPFALFLGTSEHSSALFKTAMAGVTPHRAIMMLDVRNALMIDRWVARTHNAPEWRDVMRILARSACIIVLDARYITQATSEECDWLLKERLGYKLIVIGDTMGNCPLLDSSAIRLRRLLTDDSIVIVAPGSLPNVVRVFTKSRLHIPTADNAAGRVLNADGDVTQTRPGIRNTP
jgi:hypothetical protein